MTTRLDVTRAATHALAVVGNKRQTGAAAQHPAWCAQAHHCTARHTTGEHRSIPEVWQTSAGRIVGVRTRRAGDGVDHLELSLTVELAYDDATAEQQCRTLIAATTATVHDVLTGQIPNIVDSGRTR